MTINKIVFLPLIASLALFHFFGSHSIASASPLQDLAGFAASRMAESEALGNIPVLKLNVPDDTRLRSALAGALAAKRYRISPSARTTINGMLVEVNGPFWERPSRRFTLHVSAVKKGDTVWSAALVSPRELIPCWWAIPLRIAVAIVLWPLIVGVLFRITDMGYEKRKYLVMLWVVLVLVLAWTYFRPTYFG